MIKYETSRRKYTCKKAAHVFLETVIPILGTTALSVVCKRKSWNQHFQQTVENSIRVNCYLLNCITQNSKNYNPANLLHRLLHMVQLRILWVQNHHCFHCLLNLCTSKLLSSVNAWKKSCLGIPYLQFWRIYKTLKHYDNSCNEWLIMFQFFTFLEATFQ